MKENISKRLLRAIPVRIILPVMLTLLLFVMTIFLLVLPDFEARLMEGKREVIFELTESAWSTLKAFEEKEKSGVLTGGEARAASTALAIASGGTSRTQ